MLPLVWRRMYTFIWVYRHKGVLESPRNWYCLPPMGRGMGELRDGIGANLPFTVYLFELSYFFRCTYYYLAGFCVWLLQLIISVTLCKHLPLFFPFKLGYTTSLDFPSTCQQNYGSKERIYKMPGGKIKTISLTLQWLIRL